MATRRLKFLSRQKLLQEHLAISLEVSGVVKRFTAQLSLESYEFPSDARVWIDAKQLLETIRLDWGTVGELRKGPTVDISRLTGERVTFNVYVVDATTSRKLGSAVAIRPRRTGEQPQHAAALLPVDASGAVRPRVWKIAFSELDEENHSDAPVLLVDNIAAKGSAVAFLEDAGVKALVLPAAMKEVLTRVLAVERTAYDDSSRAWRHAWLRFASRLIDEAPPSPGASGFHDEASDWIERSIDELSRKGELFDAFVKERVS